VLDVGHATQPHRHVQLLVDYLQRPQYSWCGRERERVCVCVCVCHTAVTSNSLCIICIRSALSTPGEREKGGGERERERGSSLCTICSTPAHTWCYLCMIVRILSFCYTTHTTHISLSVYLSFLLLTYSLTHTHTHTHTPSRPPAPRPYNHRRPAARHEREGGEGGKGGREREIAFAQQGERA
jgi:hypothetical protein